MTENGRRVKALPTVKAAGRRSGVDAPTIQNFPYKKASGYPAGFLSVYSFSNTMVAWIRSPPKAPVEWPEAVEMVCSR